MVITMGKAIESCVIVHSVPSSLRRSSLNSLREWDLICSLLNHFLTDFAVNAESCMNSNDHVNVEQM